jgi:hypothetical protein
MIRSRNLALSILCVVVSAGLGLAASSAKPPISERPAQPLQPLFPKGKTPKTTLRFEPNLGQTNSQVRYVSRGRGATIFITDRGAVLTSTRMPAGQELRGKLGSYDPSKFVFDVQAIRMDLAGSSQPSVLKTEQPQESFSSYYLGSDRTKWLDKVPHYGRVQAKAVYPGVDIVYYGNEGQLEYDFVVAPGADTKQIHLAFSGQDSMQIAANGDLLLKTAHGDFVQHRPVVYQEIGGRRVEVASSYRIDGVNVGFELARYDASRPLVIDPTLNTSTYLGGGGTDLITATGTATVNGGLVVTGYTSSLDFPLAGTSPTYKGGSDAFVAILNQQTGAPLQSTYFGGSGLDVATSVSSSVYDPYTSYVCIGGFTTSADFPLTVNPAVPTYDTGFVGFVTCFSTDVRLSLSGISSPPVASSYVGTRGTQVNAVSFASNDAARLLIAGQGTRGYIFASPQVTSNGGTQCWSDFSCYNANSDLDAFAGFFNLLYVGPGQLSQIQTGGTGDDAFLAISGATTAFVAVGSTQSTNLQLHNAVKGTKGGSNQNAFLFVFAGSPICASYYGGNSGGDTASAVTATVDVSGVSFVLGGATSAATWPTAGPAIGSANAGGYDGFVAQMRTTFSPNVTSILYSTSFGGNGDDYVNAIDVHNEANTGNLMIYAAGQTRSSNLLTLLGSSTALAGQTTLKGVSDAFVMVLRPVDGVIKMLTYLGGSGSDSAVGIKASGYQGNDILVAGSTGGPGDFPTVSHYGPANAPFQPNYGGGGSDGFFSSIWMPSTVAVSLAAWDPANGLSIAVPVPFSVILTNCTSSDPQHTYWTGTCNTAGSLGTMTFTFPAQYSSNGAKLVFSKGPDGTTSLTQTVTAQNFYDQVGYVVYYDPTFQLNISTAGTGSGTATPISGNYYKSSDLIPITATPAPGSVFTGWTITSPLFSAFIANPALASTTVNVGGVSGASIVANFSAIVKTNPVITWPNPAPMIFGSALGSAQLNATANVPGTFAYTPPAGTVFTAGTNRMISVTFTPNDTATYNVVNAQVSVDVLTVPGGLVVTRTLSRIPGGNVAVSYTIANTSALAAANVMVTGAAFGGASGAPMPQSFGTLPPGAVASGAFTIAGNPGVSGVLSIAGTYAGGTFSSSSRTTLP